MSKAVTTFMCHGAMFKNGAEQVTIDADVFADFQHQAVFELGVDTRSEEFGLMVHRHLNPEQYNNN